MLYLDWMSRFSGFIPQWIHFGVVCGILRLLMIFAIGVKNSNRRQMSRNRMVNNCTSSWWWWWWWWAAGEEDEGGEDQDPSSSSSAFFFHLSSDHQKRHEKQITRAFPSNKSSNFTEHHLTVGVWFWPRKVVKRPHPKWTLARISFLIYGLSSTPSCELVVVTKALKKTTKETRPYLCGGNSKIFYFHSYLGKVSILTNIFQMGWNRQLVMNELYFLKYPLGPSLLGWHWGGYR